MTPLIGSKAWFGPRRFGWGWSPVTAEGWAVLAAGTGAALAAGESRRPRLLAAALMLLVIVLKGTSPGGPGQRRAFDSARNRP